MNQNLNTSHHQHHLPHSSHPHLQQQAAQGAGSANDNGNVLVYTNHPGEENANRCAGGGMTSRNCSVPPNWIKQHRQPQHPPSPGNVGLPMPSSSPTVNSCPSSSTSSTYGAYSQPQQQTFYSADHPFEENNAVQERPPPNFNTNSAFYTNESTSSDYYQSTPQFQSFDSTKSLNCGNDAGNISTNSNFLNCNSGFYPVPNNHQYNHQHHQYQSQHGVKYFRNVNYNNSETQDPNMYFATGSQPRVSNSIHGQSQHVSGSEFRMDHSSNLPATYRRNSIESFSTEPGELSYNSKYGAYNNNSGQFVHQAKRDGFPSWSTTGANTNSHGSCQGYFFHSSSNQNQNQSHRHYGSPNNNFGHQHCSSPVLPGNYTTNQPQQQQQFVQNFGKSCSYDDSGSGPRGCTSQGGGGLYRTTALKHRSLSLQYPRSDQLVNFQDPQQQHLVQIRTPNYSSTTSIENTNKSVPDVTEIRKCSDSGSNPSSQCGENRPNSSDCTSSNSHVSLSPQDRTSTVENVQDNVNCNPDTLVKSESGDPSQSNLSELNISNSGNSNNSTEPPSGCTSDGNGIKQEDNSSKSDVNNVISTTTLSPDENTCHQVQLECDNSTENDNDNDLSNSSSLALFDSITLMNTLTASPLSENGDDSASGLSSSESTAGIGQSHDRSPQKITKRSFSEADKDLVINTSAITAAMAFGIRRNISVPTGWKRELTNISRIHYISPSSTKLQSWEELKNYVSSDGTCKCGLNCPLWLEHTFSFDPKVTCEDAEESQPNLSGKDVKMGPRFCCNHKRKAPSSEDYPLISSTRDDLGDFTEIEGRSGKSIVKKRKVSGPHDGCANDTNKYTSSCSMPALSKTSSPTPQTQNVSVPFSQQSPDTTTQTPQRDMSPASSVSSERSSASRSNNTTPTPVTTKSNPTTSSSSTGQDQHEFAWPTTPTTITGVTPNRTPSPPPPILPSIGNTRKPISSYQNYVAPKSNSGIVKRYPPCPNIDVRQIPLEQNQPPPRPNQIKKESPSSASSTVQASSHVNQTQNPTVSFIPVTSGTTLADHNFASLNTLNTGYSISPVVPTAAVSTVNFGTSVNNSTYQFANILPMQMPIHRMISTSSGNFNPNMLIAQSLPRSITISMVEQHEKSVSPIPGASAIPSSATPISNKVEQANNSTDSLDRVSEKSPLQLAQDVVDRFHTRPGESGININSLGGAPDGSSSSKNDSGSVSSTLVVSKDLNTTEVTVETNEEIKPRNVEPIPIPTSTSFVYRTMAITSNATLTSIETPKNLADGTSKPDPTLTSISIFPASSSISIQPITTTNSSSSANACITTSSVSNVPIMAHGPLLSCTNNGGGFNLTNLSTNGNSLILQQQPDQNNQNQLFATAAAGGNGGQPIRYPLFQTLQPIILNSNGTSSSLIISPQSQPTSVSEHPSYIQIDQHQSHHQTTADMLQNQTTGTTMVIDSSMCGNLGANILCGGPRKKKKRLSKKQQQQQAQLQLQQQLLLQQLHQQVQAQQVQAAAQQQIPLLFPQSYSLGQSGFSLQPMNMNMNMNFFPTPTILTLPNIILNPADPFQQLNGTLFIQQPPGTPLSATATTTAGGLASDDSRQNATPDSSTNDCQLGLIASSTSNSTNSITVSLPLSSNTNLQNKKLPLKSKAVSSSSSSVKRILPQKQILPKIDSTTPSVENN